MNLGSGIMNITDYIFYWNGLIFGFVGIAIVVIIVKLIDIFIFKDMRIFECIRNRYEDQLQRKIATAIFITLMLCVTFLLTFFAVFK